MPLPLRRRVASLEALHAQYESLEEVHAERLRELELAFAQESLQIFDRRQAIIAGEVEPTDEEVSASTLLADLAEAEIDEPPVVSSEPVHGVPAFWSTVMRHSGAVDSFEVGDDEDTIFEMNDADKAVLDHLCDLRVEPWEGSDSDIAMREEGWETNEDGLGYVLRFRFAPNAFLESEELALYCTASGEVVEADVPLWRSEECDPTIKWASKKKKKKGGEARVVKVAKPVESFFRIFADPATVADDDSDSTHGLTPLGELQEEMVMRLREEVIPRAAMHYLGALHGFPEDDGETHFEDDGDDWEMAPPPRRGAR